MALPHRATLEGENARHDKVKSIQFPMVGTRLAHVYWWNQRIEFGSDGYPPRVLVKKAALFMKMPWQTTRIFSLCRGRSFSGDVSTRAVK